MFTTIPPALPHVQAGKLKALAVANAKRSTILPDIPTTAEGGAPGVEASSWNGFMAPAKTPREIVARLSVELGTIMAMNDVAERLRTAGVEPLYDKPDEFVSFMAEETARYAKVVRLSHARID
jgi:tripartite-type tricarboxylate transporter receptor subunit TctC